jgi:hypothetical protein
MPVSLFIPLLFLVISSFLVYFLVVYLFPVSESQQIFMEMYVPHEDRGKKRFTLAFVFIRLALLLCIFRVFSWIIEIVVPYEFTDPTGRLQTDPFIAISNYALGGAYLLGLLAAVIMMPYVRKKLVRRRKFELYVRKRFFESKSGTAGGDLPKEK